MAELVDGDFIPAAISGNTRFLGSGHTVPTVPEVQMPVPYPDALDEVCAQAADKSATLVKSPVRFFVQAMLAGAFVGVAVVLMVSTAGPLASASSPATKLVQGTVFGIALTLVVFAGAELFTSNNLTMLVGWLRGRASGVEAIAVNAAALVGNFAGSLAFAAVVNASGVLNTSAKGKPPAGAGMIATIVAGKVAATDGQLFWRAVLCNALVCLGVWMAIRTKNDAAKLIVLFWVLMAFIASGFEHSVANMTIFSLAIFENTATWGQLGHNLLLTVPGNLVGGALVVGLPYALSTARRSTADEPATAVSEPSAPLAASAAA
jgi:nitrite transporter NirC